MDKITEQMMEIYNTYTMDWMDYIIINNNLTYHHIIKKENGGKRTIDNGALLTDRAHEYLHTIERLDVDIYNRINKIFKEINGSKKEPTKTQRRLIDLLLCEFELKNADKLIPKKEKKGNKKILAAYQKRVNSQLGI
ncbi:MAG: hypothetical protein IJI49_04140 [Bacilli bacterium]|nr:hypothetical protein [Bacilli bacterium]